MARKLSKRETALLVALAVIAVVFLWRITGNDGGAPGGAGGRAGEEGRGGAEPPVVRMDQLTASFEAYDAAGRDLFKYGQPPKSPQQIEAETRRQEAIARQQSAPPPPPPPPPVTQPVRTGPPPPPSINLTYLGYFGPKEGKIAIFENGKDILIAQEGEVVLDQFKVVEIRYESVVMGYTKPEYQKQTRELAMSRSRR